MSDSSESSRSKRSPPSLIKASQLKNTIDKLNSLGITSYKPDDELSRFQLYRLRKKYDEFKSVINHPEHFHVVKVSKETAKVMKSSGIKVSKTMKAIVPLKGYEKAIVKGDKISLTGTNRKTGKKVTEQITLAGADDFHAKLKHLSKKKLKKNQYLTVKIGDNAAFNSQFTNYADLYHYVHNVFEPKDPGESKEKLLRYMSVVEINGIRESKPKKATNAQKTKGTPPKRKR